MEDTDKKEILEAISDFATSVDKRFDGVDKRFDGVDKRFDGVDKRFDKIENRMDSLENEMKSGFASIRAEIAELKTELNAKIDTLDKRTCEDTEANMKDYSNLKERVEKLERQIQQMHPA